MKITKAKALLSAVATGILLFAAAPANAQNTNYTQGDLTMFFQDSASSTTLLINLGSATSFRDATSSNLNFLNINSQLETAFGEGWSDSSTLKFGLAGVYSSDQFGGITDGDPSRTVYASKARLGVGTDGVKNSTLVNPATSGSMNTLSGNVFVMTNRLETQSSTISLQESFTNSTIDNQNPTSGAAYSVISGGTQYAFTPTSFGTVAGITAEGALDLYRIDGTSRAGTYEGSFIIDGAGGISYIAAVPEPSTVALLGLALGAILFFVRRRGNVTA